MIAVPSFDAVGATGDLCVTLPAALTIAWRFKLPVIIDRGEAKLWGTQQRFEASYDFRGGRIVWVK